jgi:hypothetical protein
VSRPLHCCGRCPCGFVGPVYVTPGPDGEPGDPLCEACEVESNARGWRAFLEAHGPGADRRSPRARAAGSMIPRRPR